ncbi:MAG: hypothetical protein LBQ95_08645 [Lachnospiraceae bacterium]|jgi:hypothetical protein|nr:hypothetical protein [Lachnospiraceae bacterium]
MTVYADYDYYTTEYGGTMSEEDFARQSREASALIRYLTLGRADNYEDTAHSLAYATCAVADMLLDDSKSGEGVIKSENNDGYSVSYISAAKEGETAQERQTRKALAIINRYLFGTGLLSRKVALVNDGKYRHHNL